MPKFVRPGLCLDYDIRKSEKAKNARIDVGIGVLRVVIPKKSFLDPERFLDENLDWVLSKKREYDSYIEKLPERVFEEGETIPFLGKYRKIKIIDGNSHKLRDNYILIAKRYIGEKSIKDKVRDILKREAKMEIKKRVRIFSKKIQKDYNKIFIRDQKTKWGSCSSKNNLSFNWKLCLGPEKVLNYVVAHELTHLENMKHDKNFWKSLEEKFPDYRKGRQWLKEKSHELVFSKEDYLNRR